MKNLATLMLAAALAPADPAWAQAVTPSLTACQASPYEAPGVEIDLQGQWDFLMLVGSAESPGILSLGPMDGGYAGSLSPYRTNTVAVRKLTLDGSAVRMSVASREGEVVFEGALTGNPDTMCGTVLYHGGQKLPMVAVRRAAGASSRPAPSGPAPSHEGGQTASAAAVATVSAPAAGPGAGEASAPPPASQP